MRVEFCASSSFKMDEPQVWARSSFVDESRGVTAMTDAVAKGSAG